MPENPVVLLRGKGGMWLAEQGGREGQEEVSVVVAVGLYRGRDSARLRRTIENKDYAILKDPIPEKVMMPDSDPPHLSGSPSSPAITGLSHLSSAGERPTLLAVGGPFMTPLPLSGASFFRALFLFFCLQLSSVLTQSLLLLLPLLSFFIFSRLF